MSDISSKTAALLRTLVPEEDGFPSAGDLDIPTRFAEDVAADANESLVLQLVNALPNNFATQSDADRESILRAVEVNQPAVFGGVLRHVYNAYYTNPTVRDILEKVDGYPARPPLYAGYEMEKFDPETLAVQRNRKPFWRKS